MKIAHITPGAGGMICGSCIHDNTLARALIAEGHDVALVPVYTPIRTDESSVSIDEVFYGAINVFLEQKSAIFRHTPRILDRALNSKALLQWAANRGSTIDAKLLGALTLSMLEGEDGHQRKELDRLVEWLAGEYRPDLVHLSNSMLLGLARRIREALDVPVLCSVQGEDIFLDELEEPFAGQVTEVLRRRAADVDGFVAPSRYYVEHMSRRLGVAPERMHHIPLGLNLEGFGDATARIETDERPLTIGFLARICPEKGLHVLTEAVRDLIDEVGEERVRLRIAGYLGPRDRKYFDDVMGRAKAWGIAGAIDHVGEVDRQGKLAFLESLDVLSVPTTYREPKGLSVLEALACGVPVVQPRHGSFPELIEATGGGLLVEPGSAPGLTRALRGLMDDPELRRRLGRSGREAVHRDFNDRGMAQRTIELYRSYVEPATEARRQ